MKRMILIVVVTAIFGCLIYQARLTAADNGSLQTCEYVTIRWDGRDNTHLVRSNGKVEFLAPILKAANRPSRADERVFYMNVAMNAVAKEGYEFAGMTSDEIVMKRILQK